MREIKECPKCKAKIDNLIQFSPAYQVHRCRAMKSYCQTLTGKCQSYLNSEHIDTIETIGDERWECPVCHATICQTRMEALDFLKED